MIKSMFAISVGGSLGSLLRWWLGTRFNTFFPAVPPGTLLANLLGAYVIGLGIAFFAAFSSIAPEWRLFMITGFCGGLTTFSTFSAEIVALIQQKDPLWMCGAVLTHLAGSVLLTLAGIGTVAWIRGG
jgi:CrcB protein